MPSSSESDVSPDDHLARTRETGGADPDRKSRPADDTPDTVDPDGGGTTGTDESGEFVGRVSGQDAGYEGETGAEARAEQARKEDSR